jgi:large conductance mechanosensitive channel
MLKEFKNFIMTGNVIDLSIAVILGAALGAVVTGFTNDIMMPIVGHFTGGMDFSQMKYILTEGSVSADGTTVAENAIMWGKWVNGVINLVIVGFVLFMIVKAYNKTKKPPVEAAPAGPSDNQLLGEIRDLLKKD